MAITAESECDAPKYTTPVPVKPFPGGSDGGHEFVSELPETGQLGVEYILLDDISDCSTYKGTYVWSPGCEAYVPTSGTGGGSIERYTFEVTDTGWRAKRNNTVIFTYVDKDTIDSYEDTADGFQIVRNGVVIFAHTDPKCDCKKYTITSTDDGWVFKEGDTVLFTYTEPENTPSDGTYFTSGTLTTAIKGTTNVPASSVTGLSLSDVVVGETLIYDVAGTVGRVTAVTGTDLTVETITTSPGERRGTRLGAVDHETDLPTTCAAAVALGWQTPLAGDFAYVREDSSHDDHLTEWVIQSIDGSCNITWAYSHTLNAGNYVLDIYKYGDYPSGSPIPKNPDGSVTLPKDEDTKYDFENILDGTEIIGWRVKNHETGAVIYTHNDKDTDTDTTYDFENVTVSGKVVGWRVKDHATGTVVYTYTDLDDKSDGTYFTTATLDTDIADQTTVAISTVSGLTASDVVVGETLIYDAAGTVGVVTAISGSNLTVDTITVSGSGDASSYVYKSTTPLNTTVENSTTVALSALTNSAGTVPTASDIIIGKTLAYDGDGTVALAIAISGSDVAFKTVTIAGASGQIVNYQIDSNGDELDSVYVHLQTQQIANTISQTTDTTLIKNSGTYAVNDGKIVLKPNTRVQINATLQCNADGQSGTILNAQAQLYDYANNVVVAFIRPAYHYAGYAYTGMTPVQYDVPATGAKIGLRITQNWTNKVFNVESSSVITVQEIGRIVDPIKYLDNSQGLNDTPVGNIISFMGNNVPKHYLACDGATYNVGDYPELEAFFLKEFGSVQYFGGDSSTGTWKVPNLQGEFLRGTGTNGHTGNGSGAAVGVHQDATTYPRVFADGVNITVDGNPNAGMDASVSSSGTYKYVGATTYNAPGRQAWRGRPTNTSIKWCIKCESTYAVMLESQQYKVEVGYRAGVGLPVRAVINTTTVYGDSSMIDTASNRLVAPVSGWYNISVTADQLTSKTPALYFGIHDVTGAQIDRISYQNGYAYGTYSGVSGTVMRYLNAGESVDFLVHGADEAHTGRFGMVLLAGQNTKGDVAYAMAHPNLWAAGVEQDFGDGLYGKRFTGTITQAVGMAADLTLDAGYVNIVSSGGRWCFENGSTERYASANGSPSFSSSSVQIHSGFFASSVQGLNFRSYVPSGSGFTARTNAPYDLWVIYTK